MKEKGPHRLERTIPQLKLRTTRRGRGGLYLISPTHQDQWNCCRWIKTFFSGCHHVAEPIHLQDHLQETPPAGETFFLHIVDTVGRRRSKPWSARMIKNICAETMVLDLVTKESDGLLPSHELLGCGSVICATSLIHGGQPTWYECDAWNAYEC